MGGGGMGDPYGWGMGVGSLLGPGGALGGGQNPGFFGFGGSGGALGLSWASLSSLSWVTRACVCVYDAYLTWAL